MHDAAERVDADQAAIATAVADDCGPFRWKASCSAVR
jgi:hypothetical protein